MKKRCLMLLMLLLLCGCAAQNAAPSSSVSTPQAPAPVVSEPVEPEAVLVLENGLEVLMLTNTSAVFVEDGSDQAVDPVCTAVFRNRSDQMLQYAQVSLQAGEDNFQFTLTTIPTDGIVVAYETNRLALPDGAELTSGQVERYAPFVETPTLQEDRFRLTASNKAILVENISGQDLTRGFYIYYKNVSDDWFVGGITYRVSVPALAAGASYNALTSHFSEQESQLMFVDYAE